MRIHILLSIFLILFITFHNTFSQSQPNEKPLSEIQLEALIKNVDKVVSPKLQDLAISVDIRKRGLDFQITSEILTHLNKIGAGKNTILTLENLLRNTKSENFASNKIKVLVMNFGDLESNDNAVTGILIEELQKSTKDYSHVEIISSNEKINPQQGRGEAVVKGKERDASIVIWGWYEKSPTSVLIYPHFETISNNPDIPNSFNIQKQIREISKFDSFEVQMQLSKDMSFFTLVSLGLINFELEDFDEAVRCLTDALSGIPHPQNADNSLDNRTTSEIYLYRALANNSKCNPVEDTEISKDINEAIKLGLNPTDSRIPLSYITKDINKQIDITQEQLQNAKTDKDKIGQLLLLSLLYSVNNNESKGKEYAQKIIDYISILKESSENYLYLSISYLLLENFEKGVFYLNNAKRISETNNKVLYAVYSLESRIHSMNEEYDLADESFKKRIQIRPRCYEDYVDLAENYENQDKFDSALSAYDKAIELNPKEPSIYIYKAEIYKENHNYEKSLEYYQKAIDVNPNLAASYCKLGRFLSSEDKLEDSLVALTKCSLIDPENAEAYEYTADVYSKKREDDLAIANYKKAFELLINQSKDRQEDFQYFINRFYNNLTYDFQNSKSDYSKNRHNLASKFIDKYIQLYPSDAWGYCYKSIMLKKNDLKSSFENISKAINLKPDEADYYKRRAEFYLEDGNLKGAIDDYDIAVKLNFKDKSKRGKNTLQEMLIGISDDLKISGVESDITLNYLDKYIQIFPKDGWGYYYKFKYFQERNNFTSAIKSINVAIELEPENPKFYIERAKFYLHRMFLENHPLINKVINKQLIPDLTRQEVFDEFGFIKSNQGKGNKPNSNEKQLLNKNFTLAITDYEKALYLTSKMQSQDKKKYFENLIEEIYSVFSATETKGYSLEVKAIEAYIQAYPEDDLGYYYKSKTSEDRGDITTSVDNISKAITVAPKNSMYYGRRASLLIEKKSKDDFDRALEDITKAIQLEPDEPTYYSTQAEIYEKKGEIKFAVESLAKAIKIIENRSQKDFFDKYYLKNLKDKLESLESGKTNQEEF